MDNGQTTIRDLDRFEAYAPVDRASKLTGLPERQLRQWQTDGIWIPWLVRERRGESAARLYDFTDLVGLRILAQLRGEVGSETLRELQPALRERQPAGWRDLTIVARDHRLTIARDPAWPTDQNDTLVIRVIDVAEALRREIEQMRQRGPDEIGVVVRNPEVMGNAWRIAGTRIPTEAIWNFHEAGYDAEAIVREYPRLRLADVQAALAHEGDLRQQGAA